MQNYEILQQIGKGSFGIVQKIKRIQDNKILVSKEINYGKMSEREKQQLVAEVNIIRELNHPNIVKYYDRIIDKKETKIFIIMEYCEGGDLSSLLKKCKKTNDYISEDVIWKIFTQILFGLSECHNRQKNKILHRDLKPANIFLDSQNNIKLGDFGLSRILSENSEFAKTHVGTPYYMSPEQIQECKYNEKSDIWSLGCLLYEMAALKPPFQANNHLALAIKIKSGQFERLPIKYSEDLQQLIQSMLNINPEQRPSVEQLMKIQQVSLRLKEKEVRQYHSEIKQKEDEYQRKADKLNQLQVQIADKEKNNKNLQEYMQKLENQILLLQQQTDNCTQDTTMCGKSANSSEESLKGRNQLITYLKNSNVLAKLNSSKVYKSIDTQIGSSNSNSNIKQNDSNHNQSFNSGSRQRVKTFNLEKNKKINNENIKDSKETIKKNQSFKENENKMNRIDPFIKNNSFKQNSLLKNVLKNK